MHCNEGRMIEMLTLLHSYAASLMAMQSCSAPYENKANIQNWQRRMWWHVGLIHSWLQVSGLHKHSNVMGKAQPSKLQPDAKPTCKDNVPKEGI